jgi:outer membrane lipoprotein-sorting protein
MNSKENKLSNYIDCLNEERKPIEHGNEMEIPEMEELLETVRLVRSLKEPSIPEMKYAERLEAKVNNELLKEKTLRKPRRRWFYGMVSAAAAVALVVTLNTIGPFSKTNMVYAMEQAFKGVKAYHGVLEVIETNAEGKSTTQSKVEVWADKEGRYYVKGLEGAQKDLITVNDGQKKWQVQPQEKEVDVFAAFPDPYSFTFEIGKEIEDAKNAIKTKVVGDDIVSGRAASIMEVTPQGGSPYKIWVDKETKMPLQKQSAMEYSLQYKVLYTSIDFSEDVPKELLAFSIPNGFKETNNNPEQVVNSFEKAKGILGFVPKLPKDVPALFTQKDIVVNNNAKVSKISYATQDNNKKVLILQKKASNEFKASSRAILGKVNNNVAEVQSPVQDEAGVLQGMGAYTGVTGITSIRWQQDSFEYAVLGNTSLDELEQFVKGLANGIVELSESKEQIAGKPQVEVPVNLKAEKGDQKNADAGHSPWKLDPAFVAQVFVSLKISPEGIQGDYPIKYEEFKVIQNNGKEAVVEVAGTKTPITKVYLKRLIRQDNTGIWTVVGYDPVKK